MPDKTVSASRVTMSKVMEPTDANFLGKVFGGSILSMLDLVAYAVSSRFAGNICVTASFDRVDFIQPIEVGELVTCEGYVSYVGRTSVEVTIEVFAENIFKSERRHTNTARVTMVAIKDGKPIEVPRLVCETREDRINFLEGKLRRDIRGRQRAEFDQLAQEIRTMSDSELLIQVSA
ncbi:MAG: acyl-CoA thioesterase [Fimbriimonadaceae bacterium]